MDPEATVEAVTNVVIQVVAVTATFLGIGLLGLVAVGLVVLPPYLGLRFGPEEHATVLAGVGALGSILVAYYVAGPLFTTGATYLGKRYR